MNEDTLGILFIIIAFAIYFGNIVFCYKFTKSKNRGAIAFALLAAFMPMIGFIVALVITKKSKPIYNTDKSGDFSFLLEKEKQVKANQSIQDKQTKPSTNTSSNLDMLNSLTWDFSKDIYSSTMLLEMDLKKKNPNFTQNVNTIIIAAQNTQISYQYNDELGNVKNCIKEIKTYDSKGFTLINLMCQINNTIHQDVKHLSSAYFDGISRDATTSNTPIFLVKIKS